MYFAKERKAIKALRTTVNLLVCTLSGNTIKYEAEREKERTVEGKTLVFDVRNLIIDIKDYFYFDFFAVKLF